MAKFRAENILLISETKISYLKTTAQKLSRYAETEAYYEVLKIKPRELLAYFANALSLAES